MPSAGDEIELRRGSKWVQSTVIEVRSEYILAIFRLPGFPKREVRVEDKGDTWREVGGGKE